MSDTDSSIQYSISADPSQFKAGSDIVVQSIDDMSARIQGAAQSMTAKLTSSWAAATKSVEGNAKEMTDVVKSSFDRFEMGIGSANKAFRSLTGTLAGITAVVAGGAAFEKVIGASSAWAGESKKLSVALGVTTERASVMLVAMAHLGLDSDVVTSATAKMSKQIFSNADAFKTLGVAVKDGSGQYRPSLEIMGEVNSKLKAIKNPIEQNIAGMQVYGKSWTEVRGVIKLTSSSIKEAEQRTKDLGLVVGDEAVEQAKKYKEANNDLKLVLKSLEIQMGNAVMPAFLRMGSWLSSIGPLAGKLTSDAMQTLGNVLATVADLVGELWKVGQMVFSNLGEIIAACFGGEPLDAMTFFANCLKTIEMLFVGFKISIQSAIEVAIGLIEGLAVNLVTLADVAWKALRLDFSGAKAAWVAGTSQVRDIAQKHMENLINIASEGKDKLDEIAMRQAKTSAPIKDKDQEKGPQYDFKDPDKDAKVKSRMAEWEEKLALDKQGFEQEQQAAGTAHEFSKAQERDYWKSLLEQQTMTKEERISVDRRYLALEHDLRKEAFDADIAGQKANLEHYKHNFTERIAIANTIYNETVARYGAESKEAIAALGEVNKEERASAEQTLALNRAIADAKRNNALADIDYAQKEAEAMVSNHEMTTAQLLEQESSFENRRFQIKMAAMRETAQLLKGSDSDPLAVLKNQNEIEDLERQHQAKLQDIRNKSIQEQNREWQSFQNSTRSTFENNLAGMLSGTTTWQKSLANVWNSILQGFTQFISKKVVSWALGEQAQTTATVAGNAERTTSDWLAAAQSVAANAWSAIKNIAMKAWEVAASVYSSLAAIPVVGPFIAPAAAVAATGVVLGFAGHIASAAGGFDIPAGVNPVTQLHEKEMVLPAKHADVIRGLADGGSLGGGHIINYHDNSGMLSKETLRRNAKIIADVLKDHARKQ